LIAIKERQRRCRQKNASAMEDSMSFWNALYLALVGGTFALFGIVLAAVCTLETRHRKSDRR